VAHPTLQFSTGFVAALFLGTFVEYVVHRLMHARIVLGKKHAEHHRDGWGQGVLGEFKDYLVGGVPVLLTGCLLCVYVLEAVPAGLGFAAGGFVYAILASYAHQVQHERPELVFWLKRPVHHLHHKHHMWKHNFGILVDFWDRLFGTYQPVEWRPDPAELPLSFRQYFQIKWF
jgi:sterol desaturase/sphingolipid hydroxylase (fatty acid hydroxylase superfamily)